MLHEFLFVERQELERTLHLEGVIRFGGADRRYLLESFILHLRDAFDARGADYLSQVPARVEIVIILEPSRVLALHELEGALAQLQMIPGHKFAEEKQQQKSHWAIYWSRGGT
jgi:hypothetical protein